MELPLWFWVVIILGIDVSHVWSTIFRTYLDKEEFSNHRKLLTLTPLVCFALLFGIASVSSFWFWRILAYLALFHFIKQQYGFMKIYQMKNRNSQMGKYFKDSHVIYFSMLYPVFYWHINSNRGFNWFVDGDFFAIGELINNWVLVVPTLNLIGNTLYWLVLIGWLTEQFLINKKNDFPWAKALWVITTGVNWYLGIVYFNSDIAFTLTNVVAHGIPYMALVFFYVEKKKVITGNEERKKANNGLINIAFMFIIVLLLALGEEYFWDMFLYREKTAFFEAWSSYPLPVLKSPWVQAAALALLSLPQVSHYVIDGFIWKNSPRNPYLRKVLS
ncbi:hypothetical protein R9C00_27510 [Flammeovirgaceae bacterium SG7u.111]|nr:hypothetical protein [Flammeovirgaceae bacterium SG7u.132]WPO35448.1 hypothetical protein R9C00_27510 [Flammeovirgaceae bacterium SG7u.111]